MDQIDKFKKDVPPCPTIENLELQDRETKFNYFKQRAEWCRKYDNAFYYSDEEIWHRYASVTAEVYGLDYQLCDIICSDEKSMLDVKDCILKLYKTEITLHSFKHNKKFYHAFGVNWGRWKSDGTCWEKRDDGDVFRIMCASRSWDSMNKLQTMLETLSFMFGKKYIKQFTWSD